MSIEQLASSIASRNCVLFVGSGLTAESGGTGWGGLIEYLKSRFTYSKVLVDNFDIIEDILKDNNQQEVYTAVQNRLRNAVVPDKYLNLIKLPWFATFTTNYDLALEKALEEHQSLQIRVIVRGTEFQLDALQSELLCVKLMGSLDINFKEPGAMVFDKGDLAIAQDERSRIFDTLSSHAVNKKFFFFGYSFDDDLFFTNLAKLSKILGNVENTYYALFRESTQLDEVKKYKLQKNNVEYFAEDPEIFIKQLYDEVSKRNPSDLTKKRIQINSNIININSTKIGFFLSRYYPVFFDEIEENVSARSFFNGNTNSLKPFDNQWHYPRNEIKKLIGSICNELKNPETKHIFALLGYPGSGRSFTINATVNELIRKHGFLAIRIPDYSINYFPEEEELSIFLEEILEKVKTENETVNGLVFFCQNEIQIDDIFKFLKLCNSDKISIPIFLIFESNESNINYYNGICKENITFINVLKSLEVTEKIDLQQYLKEIIRIHRFPEVSDEDIALIIKEEKSFFPIIYRILDPAKRSIHTIIETRYNNLIKINQKLKDCISLCAISSFFNIPLPISILKKSLEYKYKKLFTYPDILDLIEIGGDFIKTERDLGNVYYISIYHHILSSHIDMLNGINLVDEYLCLLASSIDLKLKTESNFFGRLFIDNGFNLQNQSSKPFSKQGIVKAFEIIKERQPARPVLHHLARLYDRTNTKQDLILSLLDEALREPIERYELNERIENIQTTKAKFLWYQNKESWIDYSLNHPDILNIFALLENAQNCRIPNLHAYDVHARILRELSQHKNEDEKIILICKAIDVLNQGIEKTQSDNIDNERLNELLIECFSEINQEQALITAENLLKDNDDGCGYYTLARIEYHKNKDFKKSLFFLDLAMKSKNPLLKAIDLKIEILLKSENPNYLELLNLADKLSDVYFKDTLKSSFNKAVIYFINGYTENSMRYFKKANHISKELGNIYIRNQFWMENGHRRIFTGRIHPTLQRNVGTLYSHNIPNWNEDIYFQPSAQKEIIHLKSGLKVNFELGFNLIGPIAFELKPYNK